MPSKKRPDDLPRVLEELEKFIGSDDDGREATNPLQDDLDGPPPPPLTDRRILTDRRRRR